MPLNFNRFIIKIFLIFIVLFAKSTTAQNNFRFPDNLKRSKINFKLVNNLIVVPVNINGVELSFILDTGVGSTIIFSLEDRNTIELRNASKISLRGLGNEEPVEAVKSVHNTVKIGDATSNDHTIYLIYDQSINFSPRMGFPIHGIIGYDFFKDFAVEISYSKNKIFAVPSQRFEFKKCKKCYEADLRFLDGKRPFMDVKHLTAVGIVNLNLLIDSGSGSGLWLFKNPDLGIEVPQNSFKDYLGRGFSGDIYGKNSKISSLNIGPFELRNVTTSFPDSIHLAEISVKERQGSIGAAVLKRFNVILDYQKRKISFKKNKFFTKPFNYNMSGLTVQHNGEILSKKPDFRKINQADFNVVKDNSGKIKSINAIEDILLEYALQPRYEIIEIRPDSPGDKAGLLKGDVIIGVNGKDSSRYNLSEINDLFYSEEGKKIRLTIDRAGVVMTFTFFLEKVI